MCFAGLLHLRGAPPEGHLFDLSAGWFMNDDVVPLWNLDRRGDGLEAGLHRW